MNSESNDHSAERRVRDAIDAVKMPRGLAESTLAAIEAEAIRRGELDAFEGRRAGNALPAPDGRPTANGAALDPDERGGQPLDAVSPAVAMAAARSPQRRSHAQPRRGFLKAACAIAACLVLAVVGFGGWNAYATVTAVVSIELNPALELGVNRFDTVVAARALNEDGQAVLDALEGDVVGKGYRDAVAAITGSSAFEGYASTDAFVSINVVCDDDAQATSLMASSDDAIASCGLQGGCSRATHDEREAAHEAGMGVARYELACELMRLDPTATLEDCAGMSLRELADRIAAIDPDNEAAATIGPHGGAHHGEGGSGRSAERGHHGQGASAGA